MKAKKPKSKPDMAHILADPAGFATAVLGMDLYPKQSAVLHALMQPGCRISFRSCNEGGKTARVIAGAILWHLAMFPMGRIISTSGSFRQVKDQLVPALHIYRTRFPRFKFFASPRIETEHVNGFWEGFSTNDSGKFEGHHEDGPMRPLMIIVDEAKTVSDEIFQAVERCKPTRLLIASSPGYAEGEFYRSHTVKSQFYTTFKQAASECAHWKPEAIAALRDKWGSNHPLVRSMIDAEFMEMVEDAIVELKALENLIANPPTEDIRGERKAFCDFSWGGDGDENVLALRRGNLVTLEECFRADNLHGICGRFIAGFSRLGLKPWEIEGDEGGGGKLIIDQLASMGWSIGRVNNGSAPRFDEHYASVAAEMWFEGAGMIQRREIILPDDDDLRGQLLDRKRVPHNKGKLAIESKRDMRLRNVPSPDRADAVLGAMSPLINHRSVTVMGNDRELASDLIQQMEVVGSGGGNVLPGSHFG